MKDYNFNFILNLTSRAVNPTIRRAHITDPAITISGTPECLYIRMGIPVLHIR